MRSRRLRGTRPPSSVLGMGLRYGVATGRAATVADEAPRGVFSPSSRTPPAPSPGRRRGRRPGRGSRRRSCAASAAAGCPAGSSARAWTQRRVPRPEMTPSAVSVWPRSLTSKGTGVHVAPPSVDRSRCSRSVSSVSTKRSKPSRAPPAPTGERAASSGWRSSRRRSTGEPGRVAAAADGSAMALASPWAHSRRAMLTEPQSREGWTRLVSRIAKDREVKSMTIDVPV